LQIFPTKFVVKSVLYKIFCKKIGSNFLQIFLQQNLQVFPTKEFLKQN